MQKGVQNMSLFSSFVAVKDTCTKDPEISGWFLTPKQHFHEALGSILVFSFLIWHLWPHIKGLKQLHRPFHAYSRTWKDNLLSGALICSYTTIVIHKVLKERVFFLFQPCHLLNLSWILLSFYKPSVKSSPFGVHLCFNILLNCSFSAFVGLFGADLSCYQMPLELENWFLQHILLILVPCYYLYHDSPFAVIDPVDRETTWSDALRMLVFSFAVESLAHYVVLLPSSILSGLNINYLMCPPEGVLSQFGIYYRMAMTALLMPVVFVIRFGFYSAFRKCFVGPEKAS